MRKNAVFLLLMGTLALMGQGCLSAPTRSGAEIDIDAAIDAQIKEADQADAEERKGDTDVEVVENDRVELNTLAETSYDLP